MSNQVLFIIISKMIVQYLFAKLAFFIIFTAKDLKTYYLDVEFYENTEYVISILKFRFFHKSQI